MLCFSSHLRILYQYCPFAEIAISVPLNTKYYLSVPDALVSYQGKAGVRELPYQNTNERAIKDYHPSLRPIPKWPPSLWRLRPATLWPTSAHVTDRTHAQWALEGISKAKGHDLRAPCWCHLPAGPSLPKGDTSWTMVCQVSIPL